MSVDMDELAKELEEIENKYTPKLKKCPRIPISLHETLSVLSKEFDCLGLSDINVEKTMPEILEQVAKNARDLVQIHRNAINQIKEKKLENVARNNKHQELYIKIDEYKVNLEKLKENCMSLKNSKSLLDKEVKELKERELTYKEELKQNRRIYYANEQLLKHKIQKLQLEVDRLQEICRLKIVSPSTTNEDALQLLSKYKTNEEIYKSTIKTLQQNNEELLGEILNLKEQIILRSAKQ